jgi:hypothetical protein
MNKRALFGIIAVAVVGIGLVIAGVIIRPAFITLGIGVVLIAVWTYLVWMVRKKRAALFDDKMEQKEAERLLKMLKAYLLVAGISLAVGIVCAILHNVLYGLLEIEEAISFGIAIAGLFVYFIATIGSLVIYLSGRRKGTQRDIATSKS